MRQATLDEFSKYMCERCGKVFKSERALKTHKGSHKQSDFFTIARTFDRLREGANFPPKQLITLLKAIRYGHSDPAKAAEILSSDRAFEDLVEAIRYTGAEAWVSLAMKFLQDDLDLDVIDEILAEVEGKEAPKETALNTIYIS